MQVNGVGAEPEDVFSWDVLGANYTYLVVVGTLFQLLTIALQYAESDIGLQQKLAAVGRRRGPGVCGSAPMARQLSHRSCGR